VQQLDGTFYKGAGLRLHLKCEGIRKFSIAQINRSRTDYLLL